MRATEERSTSRSGCAQAGGPQCAAAAAAVLSVTSSSCLGAPPPPLPPLPHPACRPRPPTRCPRQSSHTWIRGDRTGGGGDGGREACGPGPGCRCAFRAGEFPPHANIILAFCDSWGSERGTRMNFSWYFLPRENGQVAKNSSRVNSSAKCQFESMQPYRKTNLSHVYEIPPSSPFLAIQISHQHCTDDVGTESPPPPPPPPSAPAMADRSGKAYSLNRRRSRSPQFVAEGNH